MQPVQVAPAAEVWRPDVTVAAVVERDGRFLLVEERVRGRLVLNQPAGHLEPDESLLDALVRETREETGWVVSPQALVGVYQWRSPDDGTAFLRFAIEARAEREVPGAVLDTGIVRALWLTLDELNGGTFRFRSPLVPLAVEHHLGGQRWSLDLLRNVRAHR
jgi:8-oxo-dGTP pyrophosphatase MutT (NUDIX family)